MDALTDVCLKFIVDRKGYIPSDLLDPLQRILREFIENPENRQPLYQNMQDIVGDSLVLDYLSNILSCENSQNEKIFTDETLATLRWTDEQDYRLIYAVYKFGTSDFVKIANFVGYQKNRKQCYDRWHRILNPQISHDPWTDEEDEALFYAVYEFGPKSWFKVSNALGNRSTVQCRYRFSQINDRFDEFIAFINSRNAAPAPSTQTDEDIDEIHDEDVAIPDDADENTNTEGFNAHYGIFFHVTNLEEIDIVTEMFKDNQLLPEVSLTCVATDSDIVNAKNREHDYSILPYTYHGDRVELARLTKLLKEIKNIDRDKQRIQNLRQKKNEIIEIIQSEINDQWHVEFASTTSSRTVDVITSLLNNVVKESKSNGYRHASIVVDLAFLVHSKSPAAYKTLRLFISQLPSERTIWTKFNERIQDMVDIVLDASRVREMLMGMDYDLPIGAEFAIAIDAICLSLWQPQNKTYQDGEMKNEKQSNDSEEQAKYLFIFLGMPLNFKEKNVVFHVIPHKSGNSANIRKKIDDALNKFQEQNIKIKYCITDGDNGYSPYHQKLFVILNTAETVDILLHNIKLYMKDNIVWILDIIHLSKLERFKFICIRFVIVVNPNDINSAVDCKKLQNACNLGDAITDVSDLGKLKDTYPITVFSVYCLCKMIEEQNYNEALFLAPLSLWYESIRNKYLDQKTRLTMMNIALEILLFLYNEAKEIEYGRSLGTIRKDGADCIVYFIGTMEIIKQMTITLAVFIIEFQNNKHLNFSHLTTMTEEHLNGLLRVMSHYKHDLKTTLTSIAEVNITLALHHMHGIIWCAASRDVQAGETFDPELHKTSIELKISPREAAFSLLKQCGYNIPKVRKENLAIFAEFLGEICNFHSPIKIGEAISNPYSGNSIFGRMKNVDPTKLKELDDTGLSVDPEYDPLRGFEEPNDSGNLLSSFPEGIIIPNKVTKRRINRLQADIQEFVRNNSGTSKDNIIYAIQLKHKDIHENFIRKIIDDMIQKKIIERTPEGLRCNN